jgi:hypothetical protein
LSRNPTLDAVRAANRAFLARLEGDPTADPAELLSKPYKVVIECAYDDEAWTVHRDGGSELRECTAYTSPLPDSVRTRGELIKYLKSSEWNWILFTLHQDFDAFHGPNPVKLD